VTTETAPRVDYPITGSYSAPELLEIAEGFYLEAARRQIEGRLTTQELADTNGVGVPRLGNGDALQVDLSPDLSGIAGLSEAEAIARLVAGRWRLSPAVATALVRTWRQSNSLVNVFFVQTATHRWTAADGYTVEIKFINHLLPGL